jgi:BlaI family transcriptional regulator, penicillinase repressor
MPKPQGSLTSTQYEILDVVWSHGTAGATVAEIWQAFSAWRPVGRTTILNHVDRLEKRGWLIRRENDSPLRYVAALEREKAVALLTGDFVDGFFGGSVRDLMVSLLGSKRLKPMEIDQLRRMLESASAQPAAKKGK